MDINKALGNIFNIEINNICRDKNSHVYSSPAPHRSCFNFKVRHEPKFTYHDLGEFLVSHDEATGFVSSYHVKPGTRDGFAGAEFKLPCFGGGIVFPKLGRTIKSFKGCLWDTAAAKKAADKHFGIESVSVGYKSISSRYDCYMACEIDKRVFDRILQLAGVKIELDETGI